MIFRHTRAEPGMWRGWLDNGQSLEISWQRRALLALGVVVHSDDNDRGSRMLHIGIGFAQAFIPIGFTKGTMSIDDEPGWGFSINRESGLYVKWGKWRKFYDLPFSAFCVEYQFEAKDGTWSGVKWADRDTAKSEAHPYTYFLKNGTVQNRIATIYRRRHIMNRRWISWFWPNSKIVSIEIEFDGEVGERSGSWKGGCIGCSYTMKPGEQPVDTLRRMEKDRRF